MGILTVKVDTIGETNVRPRIARIDTNDTLATVTASGYLSKVAQQFSLSEDMMALVSTKTSVNATSTQVAWMEVSRSGDTWSLVPSETTLPLTDGQILVGNSSNVATDVAMSGDVTIDNAGATTIQPLVVETGMLAAGSVTSAKVEETLIQHAQVDISLAELIGSYTASVELVAAPGANKKLVLHRATLWINYGGTVLADGGAVHVQYDSTANGAGTKATGTQAAATLIAATADTSLGFSPVDTTLTDATTLNTGLYLATATQDFTGGAASVYKADVWFSVMDVA